MKKIFVGAGVALAAVVGLSYMFTAADVATAPGRVVSQTVRTDNIIGNYEAFFDLKASYDGRTAQIKSLTAQLATETGSDRRYTQTDLNGARQSCRSTALKYNADSQKLNRSAFKSSGLPETLDAAACEA
jgi:hypothetical protein